MHPVIQHILERKGASIPLNDGRKTALILFGGTMTGARGAGAVTALEELCLNKAFDMIFTISAGFPNACYFLTGNTHQGASIYYEELCSKEFISMPRVWDIVDIDYGLNVIKNKKPLDYEALSRTQTDLYVRLLNISTGKPEYRNVKGKTPEELELVMHAAVSLPYLNPGSVELEDGRFKDAGTMDSDMIPSVEDVLLSDATDILVIYNRPYQYEHIRSAGIFDSERLYRTVYRRRIFTRVHRSGDRKERHARHGQSRQIDIWRGRIDTALIK
ncbi:MAG: hypothetical protein JWN50_345 [Parcubacteria group bacterium]|nr:hypothetical protein [Parcubacteria group bacterium]